jgi:hypothetical protein
MRRLALRRVPAALRTPVLLLAITVSLAACGGGGGDDGEAGTSETTGSAAVEDDGLAVLIASYDVAVGEDRRLMAGVLTSDAVPLAFGEVTFELGYLGQEPSGEAELASETTATYLPVPGLEPQIEPTQRPVLLEGEPGTGVYATEVDLDEPGFYGLRVTAELEDGSTLQGQTTFDVLAETEVPDVGDDAPRSDNLIIADVEAGEVPPVAVDSRAQGDDAEIPDPHLHDSTIAESLEAGTPVVAILSTPTYCVSTFCGPLTVEVGDLAGNYPDVDFVHIEVWRDFEEQQLNDAAAEWIQTETGGNEPWVFLIDGDGVIQARWDNVLDIEALEEQLQAL